MTESESIGTAEASEILGIDQRSVARLCTRGVLQARQISQVWIIDRQSVIEYRDRTAGMKPHDPRRQADKGE
jgi:hypothetical protein